MGARVAWAGVAPSPLFRDLGWSTKGTSPGTVVRVWEKPSQGEAAGEGFVPTSKRSGPPVPVGHQPGATPKVGDLYRDQLWPCHMGEAAAVTQGQASEKVQVSKVGLRVRK